MSGMELNPCSLHAAFDDKRGHILQTMRRNMTTVSAQAVCKAHAPAATNHDVGRDRRRMSATALAVRMEQPPA
jgi:hypothetical protein